MRKLAITTIIFLAGASICLAAILCLALGNGGYRPFGGGWNSEAAVGGNYELVLEREVDAKAVNALKIDYGMTFNDVYFYRTEGESILIREYMNFQPKENQLSRVEQRAGELSVKGTKRTAFYFFSSAVSSRDAYTEIYLPAPLAERLEDLNVITASGNIVSELPYPELKAFSASSTSGDIFFPEIKAEQIQAVSTSGSIRLTAAEAKAWKLSTTSGDISLEQARGDIQASTTSGNITVDRQEGNFHGAATSGNITVERQKGDFYGSTTSGDISLGEAVGDLSFSSTSGIVRLREGTGRFEADTTSGDIRVEKLAGDFWIESTSGEAFIAEGSGCGRAETISGDVRISLRELSGDLRVSTTSGGVILRLPEAGSWTLDFDSTSGGCSTFFDDQLHFNKRGNEASGSYGGGERKIEVSTTSGDLKIGAYD